MLKTTIADLHRRHSWDRATSVKAELKNVPSVGLTTNSCNTKIPGAYGVRYLFVIYRLFIAETENVGSRFFLGRAPEPDHLEPF
jgi:hypothetical protein